MPDPPKPPECPTERAIHALIKARIECAANGEYQYPDPRGPALNKAVGNGLSHLCRLRKKAAKWDEHTAKLELEEEERQAHAQVSREGSP